MAISLAFTLHPIIVPIVLTAAIWLTAVYWPIKDSSSGLWGFGGLLESLWHGVLALAATSLTWIIYGIAVALWG